MSLPQELQQGFSRTTVEALSRYKNEPSWMTDLRLSAWEAYAKRPFDESDVSLKTIFPFTGPPTTPVLSKDWPLELQHATDERGDEEGLIVQRDSTILSRSLTKDHSKKGVIFTDLDAALRTVPQLVQRYFGKLAKPETAAAALHTAFWSGGTFLYVPKHLNVVMPFHTCLWMSAPEAGIFSHTLIIVEGGSQVTFIDECVSANWSLPGVVIEALEVYVAPQAKVNCLHLQHCGNSVRHYRDEKSQVSPSGSLQTGRIEKRPNALLERAAELYPEVRVLT